MNGTPFIGLVQNVSLLLAMAFLSDVAASRWRTGQSSFVQVPVGIAIGAIAVTVMLTPWTFDHGIVFDARSVLLGISGLFFGPVSTATAMAITAAFRFYMGGTGTWTGIAVILTSGAIGIAWRYFRRQSLADISWHELYLFGIVVHIAMLLLMLTLPWATALLVLSHITLPVMLVYPLGTTLLGALISKRLRSEQADRVLRESEEKFRMAFYTSPDAVNINRLEDGMYISINPGFTRIMGYTEKDIIGKTSIEYNIWNDIEDRQRLVAGLKKDREVINLEAIFRTKNGDIRYGLMSASVIDLNGVPHILSVTRDITDRKRAANELIRLSQQNELILASAAEGIVGLDLQGKQTFVNPAAASMLGYKVEELLDHPSHSTWHHTRADGSPYPAEKCGISAAYRDGTVHRSCDDVFWRKDGSSFPVEYKSTPIYEKDRLAGAVVTFADITERKKNEETIEETLESLSKAVGTTIHVISSAVETRDPYTAGHQNRAAGLACAIAMDMGLRKDKIDAIRMASSIHDVGKLSIPAEILAKPTKLSEIEFSLIKEHSKKGYEMLKDVKSPWPLAEIVYQHHELMDGSGYPRNLKGEEILIEARILVVADVVEAIASHRPYRASLGIDAALNEIEKNRGIIYDAAVADACLRLFREKGFKLEGSDFKR
jgi:PAS domain S-box-containing protein